MEASGRIYEPFQGKNPLSRSDSSVLEGLLKDAGFKIWTTTEYPQRTFFSFGGRDSLDNERTMQGYGEFRRGFSAESITGYRVVAQGKELIEFMEKLDTKEL